MLCDVVANDNTASDVWADTAYRSRSNEAWLKSIARVGRAHRQKPKGKPMPARTARLANLPPNRHRNDDGPIGAAPTGPQGTLTS